VPSYSGTDGSNPIPSSRQSGASRWDRYLSSQTFSYRQPPRASRFGSPLVLSRVHWVQPELVADAKFLTRTDDNLLHQVVYEGLRPRSSSAQRLSLIEVGATMPPLQ